MNTSDDQHCVSACKDDDIRYSHEFQETSGRSSEPRSMPQRFALLFSTNSRRTCFQEKPCVVVCSQTNVMHLFHEFVDLRDALIAVRTETIVALANVLCLS